MHPALPACLKRSLKPQALTTVLTNLRQTRYVSYPEVSYPVFSLSLSLCLSERSRVCVQQLSCTKAAGDLQKERVRKKEG